MQSKTLNLKGWILSGEVRTCILLPEKIFLLLLTNKKKPTQECQDWSFTWSQTPRPWIPVYAQDVLSQSIEWHSNIVLCWASADSISEHKCWYTGNMCNRESGTNSRTNCNSRLLFLPFPCILQPGVHLSLCMVGTVYWKVTCILSLCSSAASFICPFP